MLLSWWHRTRRSFTSWKKAMKIGKDKTLPSQSLFKELAFMYNN